VAKRLPPGCGLDLNREVLANKYQLEFHAARRQRFCLHCKKVGTPAIGTMICAHCHTNHTSNLTFPRVFKSLHLRAGRRSGKSLAGAHAVREELLIPGSRWWVCSPTFKMMHDATQPTLLRLIPPEWVKNWSQDDSELTLINDSVVQFRSLDDPERGRGQGLHGTWLDEAAFIAQRAWSVLKPSLSENAGIVISTTSPGGFDWTYKEFYKRATNREKGYWARRFRTIDNPIFQRSPVLREEVAEARRTMTPELFAAEYLGDDVNFTGSIYGQQVDAPGRILASDDEVRKVIPEWPTINSTRQVIIGLDSGADHPFGALLVVVTEAGLVVVSEYLERQQAAVTHLTSIQNRFGTFRFANTKWAANKNEAQLRLEFGLRGVGVIPAENRHMIGIQRVQSWLHTNQLFIVQSHCPKLIDQMRAYRYADNFGSDGQKKEVEQVFKREDELPDALRYAVMAWPELPKMNPKDTMSERERKRWDALDDNSRLDIERIREFNKRELEKNLREDDKSYPIGDFWGGTEGAGSSTSVF
jgi:hypothetical protein